MSKFKYIETQKFKQKWLWLLFLGLALLPFWAIYQQIYTGRTLGNSPVSNGGLLIFCGGIWLLVYLFFFKIRLITQVDEYGILMRFTPFFARRIYWSEIRRMKIIDYGFAAGWGIRYSSRYGIVYHTAGRTGLYLELREGDKLVIGTSDKEKLGKAVSHYLITR